MTIIITSPKKTGRMAGNEWAEEEGFEPSRGFKGP
jgi:hypothetical protein